MSYLSELWQETRDMAQRMKDRPATIFEGPGTLGAFRQALKQNDWKLRGIGDPEGSSHDTLLGGWSSGGRRQRQTGRSVGSLAALLTGANFAGAGAGAEGAAGEGAVGASEVGIGLPLAEEAGAGAGVGSSGLIDASWGVNALEPAGEWAGTYSNAPAYGTESWWPEPGSSGGGGNWWQQGSSPSSGGGWFSNTDWSKAFGKGGWGQMGIGGLAMLLNARQQKKDAKAGEEDERAAVQQGTDALARSLSTQGNPAGSGHAQQELQNYATIALARYRAARRARMSEANQNMYGAGGVSLAALLQALAQGGAFGGSSGAEA